MKRLMFLAAIILAACKADTRALEARIKLLESRPACLSMDDAGAINSTISSLRDDVDTLKSDRDDVDKVKSDLDDLTGIGGKLYNLEERVRTLESDLSFLRLRVH